MDKDPEMETSIPSNTSNNFNRKERRKMKKELRHEMKQSWNDLNELYENIGTLIITTTSQIGNLFKIPNILNYVEDVNALKISVEGISKDCVTFSEQLVLIKKLHADKKGIVKTVDEMTDVFKVFEEYNSLTERFHAIVTPTVIEITTIFASAEEKMKNDISNMEGENNGSTEQPAE